MAEAHITQCEDVTTNLEPKFTCFPRLPKELQLMIWEAAMPGKIVEILHRNLAITVGEWDWEDAPANATPHDRIHHFVGDRPTNHSPMCKILACRDWDAVEFMWKLRWPPRGQGPEFYRPRPANLTNLEFYYSLYLRIPIPAIRPVTTLEVGSIENVCQTSRDVYNMAHEVVFATCAALAETRFNFQRDTLYFSFARLPVSPYVSHVLDSLDSITDRGSLAKIQRLIVTISPELGRNVWGRTQWVNPLDFFVSVLKIFNNLQDFTLVVRHTSFPDPDHDTGVGMHNDGSYDFIDVVDSIPLTPSDPRVDISWAKVDLLELENKRLASIEEGRTPWTPWKIPDIHYKV